MSIEDPRHYLTIQPVPPWEVAKDAKLKARSLDQYNLGSPTRLDMFRMNYSRRLRQLTSQGFMSLPSKPYQPVGTLILNAKDLVKKTLGQEKDDQRLNTSESQSLKENIPSIPQYPSSLKPDVNRRRPTTSALTSSRTPRSQRQATDLQDIASNLNMVESTKHSVKMGHSLFNVLETLESQKSELQDGSEMRFNDDQQMAVEDMKIVSAISDIEAQHGAKALPVPQSLFKLEQLHVEDRSEENVDYDEGTSELKRKVSSQGSSKDYLLWRQLCALHWLIEACRHEQGLSDIVSLSEHMIPLAECWNVVHPGGMPDTNTDRYMGTRWRNFSRSSFQTAVSLSRSTSQCSGTISNMGFLSPTSPKRTKDVSGSFEMPRSPSLLTIPHGFNTFRRGSTDRQRTSMDHGRKSHTVDASDNADNEADYHNNLVKLLDTVKESVTKEMLYRERIAEDEAEQKGRLKVPVYKWARTPYPKPVQPNFEKKKKSVSTEVVATTKKKATVHIRPHTAGPTLSQPRRADSRASEVGYKTQVRPQTADRSSNRLKRPRSSPPKLSLSIEANFNSATREQTIIKMKEQFQEVTNLKALRLHQNLTELQRSRWERMEKKFEAFHVRQRGMHRNLQVMRSAVASDKSGDRNGSRLSSPAVCASTCEWYTKLLQLTSAHESNDKACMTVLKRLEESAARCMGWMSHDSMSRQSLRQKDLKRSNAPIDNQITVESFVTVLRQLRPFEIFAPDISAAVEFMREDVVKMPQEQFEEVMKKFDM